VSHICATDEYRSQVGATDQSGNIVIRYVSFSLSSICIYLNLKVVDVFSFHLQIFHWCIAPLRADISKVTAHERIQHFYQSIKNLHNLSNSEFHYFYYLLHKMYHSLCLPFSSLFYWFSIFTQYFLFHSYYAIFLSSYVTITILFFILQKYFKNYLLKMTDCLFKLILVKVLLKKLPQLQFLSQTRLCKFCFFTRFPELGMLCFINIMVTIEIYESSDIRRDYFHTASPPKKIL
jgi:hypothetical protein